MSLISFTLDFHGVQRPFFVRPDTSDHAMATQVFVDQALDLRSLKRYPDIWFWFATLQHPLIVDAGANIGAASVFFSMMFPGAAVVAIEPELSNFAILKRNTAGLPVHAIRAAIGAERGAVAVYHPDGEWPTARHAAYRTRPAATGVPVTTMADILRSRPSANPFIAKIDIEGAEGDLFCEAAQGWIERFPVLIIELHDWLYPRELLAQGFLRAVAPLNRDFVILGEHIVSIDNRIRAD